jgi:YYY domain-containing protein
MTDLVRWLIAIEIIGVAFLPLTSWVFRRLPDRGYAFAKILGLLLVTWVTWLAGTFFSAGGGVAVPVIVIVAAALLGWWLAGNGALRGLREARRAVVIEECIFIGALVVWSLLRAHLFHPGISHTEQYMDMTFLTATDRSASFPPYDPWMSGHTVNYYYIGYLMMAVVTRLSGVSLAVGYNLAISMVFAFTLSAAYSLGYALTRKLAWAALAPLFVGVLGNWFAAADGLSRHTLSSPDWFWCSTRVVDAQGSCSGASATINEFPFFSFVLGDLHAHVIALPFTLLAVAFGCAIALSPEKLSLRGRSQRAWLAIAAIAVGSLYAINSWDFPTYLLIVAACIGANAYLTDPSSNWWRSPLVISAALTVLAVGSFAPFFLEFKSLSHGLGLVSTPSDLGQFVEVFGLFLVVAALLLVTYRMVFQPAGDESESIESDLAGRSAAEAGRVRTWDPSLVVLAAAVLAVAVVGIRTNRMTFLLVVLMGLVAAACLQRVLNTENPRAADGIALILITGGCLVLAFTEVVYLRDAFDGGLGYRMNTVFKMYYQAWTLLALAGAYGAYRGWQLLRNHFPRVFSIAGLGIVAAGTLAAGLYTWAGPSHDLYAGTDVSLNGAAQLRTDHPSDFAAIQWLSAHGSNDTVELEVVGNDYDPSFARVATFSGLPTVMGWAGHEDQWRPGDGEVGARAADVNTIYTTADVLIAKRLLRHYNVRYVFVGDSERGLKGANLGKFRLFMHVAFRSGGTLIYTW